MKLIHLRNNQVVNDVAKQPSADSLEYGEIAINYKKDKELLFIKNDQDEIVSFLAKDAVNELIIQNTGILPDMNTDFNNDFAI